MKKNVMSAVSAGLVLTMACGATVMANSNIKAVDNTEKSETPVITGDLSSDLENLDLSGFTDLFYGKKEKDKQETVYVIASASGEVEKVIVTEMLNNRDKADSIKDVTNLTNILNTKNDSEYTMSDDGIVWDAKGDKIYYRGDATNEVPVSFTITYKLDGNDITAEELAGKSGSLEMTFNYKNIQSQTVEIDGKETEIFVPFLMLSGTMIDNSVMSHIEVDHGKVIDDGDKSIIFGYALPGLNENLDFDKEIFPSSFTIKGDVKDFELTTTLTFATNDIFNQFGFDGITDTSDVDAMIESLTTAVQKMVAGANDLSDGLGTLKTSFTSVVTAVGTLTDSAAQLSEGAKNLTAGLNTVDSKLIELGTGLTTLSQNSAALNAGADKVFSTLLAQVQGQLTAAGLANYGINVPTLTKDNYKEVLSGLSATLKKYGMDTTAIDGAKVSLDEYNTFYTGLTQYTAGVDKAAAGCTALETAFKSEAVAGSETLSAGLDKFAAGIKELNGNMPALTEGIDKLATGAATLAGGLEKVYSEGIQKALAEIDDISTFIRRVEATLDVSAAYQSLGGISEDMTGSTKFVYRTGSIETK